MKRMRACLVLAHGLALAAALALQPHQAGAEGKARSGHGSITQGLDCSQCHTPAGWKSLGGGQGSGFDHGRTGFPLTGRHTQVACTGCHSGEHKITRQCNGCHADAHQGKLGQACDDCHSAQSFRAVNAIERHRLTRLPLSGVHAVLDCTDCHRRTTDQQWGPVPADCYACHSAEYRRGGLHPSHVGGVGTPPSQPFPHDCGQCHRATGWSPAVVSPTALRAIVAKSSSALTVAPERHELVFPIRHGAHRSAACEDCHASESLPQAVRCTGCHAHNPVALRAQHKSPAPALHEGGCLSCHPGGARR